MRHTDAGQIRLNAGLNLRGPTEIHSRSYGLREGQVQAYLDQPGLR